MKMMGLGYLGSSSNLSPLAPPFTVHRSNPVSHPSSQSTGGQGETTNEYGYNIHNWGNGSLHWSSVNPSPEDSLFYNTHVDLPYVNADDNPLANETDYTQNLSGLEYNNPNSNLKQEVKRMENGAYCSETLSKGKDDSSMLYYADMIRRANNKSDGTSFQNSKKLNIFGGNMLEDKPTKKSSCIVIKSPKSDVCSKKSLKEKNDQLIFEFKAKPGVPDINVPDAAAAADEDSPCWRGTPFRTTNKSINLDDQKTSSTFNNDTGVRDGVDDHEHAIKPNKSNINLPNLQQAVDDHTSALVKALYNLSDMLLWACSNQALNAHDREALDHVIRNLGMCMSTQVQVAIASTNKPVSPHSHAFQEHAYYQKMKSDVCGESVKNLQKHASLRDLDSPQGDNMVQAIKKILDENLECEAEEATLLYKNLWLEAEAELCSLTYRARFERLKRETRKEKSHKLTATGDTKETLKSCNGSTFLKADKRIVSNAQHSDDIVNVRVEENPVKEEHVAGVKVAGSSVTLKHQRCKDDDDGARLKTLKHRVP